MTNIFDVRTFNADEQNAIKMIVNDTIETTKQLDDLNSHMSENIKGLCERLNQGITDPELKMKPTLIKKIAKARIKEDLESQKAAVDEVETAIDLIFKNL